MNANLSCGIVRDLLPLYADGLTGPESNAAIDAHLNTCPDCRSVYRQMTAPEQTAPEDQAEIDYLKKVKRSKKRLLIGAMAAVLLVAALLFAWAQLRAARPTATYDEQTETLIVNGRSGYDRLTIPAAAESAKNLDAQDDRFHLSAYLPAFGFDWRIQTPASEFLPAFLDRTDRSLEFLRDYLKQNAPDCYPKENAEKYVELILRKRGDYNYEIEDDRITLWVGDYFWHRDDLYVLALMDPASIEWQHIGYSTYLGLCRNPYNDLLLDTEAIGDQTWYESVQKLGGESDSGGEIFLRMSHAAAYTCLERGLGRWGSAYESGPVSEYGLYTGPSAKPILGNAMSPSMCVSFIAWLTEEYGFETVSEFCFDRLSFQEAFGQSFQQAYDRWSAWLTEICA